MNFLTDIIERKRARLARAKAQRPLEALRALATEVRRRAAPHLLRRALEDAARPHVIAEIKRASPSRGVISGSADPVSVARRYAAGGASAISVLTEEDRFQGSLEDLRAVRAASPLPLLRKDFIFDEYQLYEAAAAGADALLLIVAALDDARLTELRRICEEELLMDALVEVHTSAEMRRARSTDATLIGVNNRDLNTFRVSLETSVELAREIPSGTVCISESGLHSKDDLLRLHALGYRGFLIGESLMRAGDPESALQALLA